MEKEEKAYRAHCLLVSYPQQGHINPILQFAKRLQHRGLQVTLVCARSIFNTLVHRSSSTSIPIETISDGYDEGGIQAAQSIKAYLDSWSKIGSETLTNLIQKLNGSAGCPVDCVVYDAFMPWCLDVAKRFGLVGAVFFTQSCAVDIIYYHISQGLIRLPLPTKTEISIPGLPPLQHQELPSFVCQPEVYSVVLDMMLGQFCNIDKADWVLCNTVYELEQEVVDWLSKIWPLRTIGPTIPSIYLDKQLQHDVDYGLSIFKPDNHACRNWLNDRPKGSVVYVSFGSLAVLAVEQMTELARGLKESDRNFLWVVRESEKAKLPEKFPMETAEKGLVVSWSPQLQVLEHEAVGCFVTHCGWNSTLEALCLGVPMVAMPQWSDQSTNAKYITDVWRIGIVAQADEKGIVRQDSIRHCLDEILKEGHRGKEIKRNAEKWRKVIKETVDEGGSTDKSINEFVASLVHS